MCGAVDFTVEGALRPVVNCHCHRCRRWSGHYWAATAATPNSLSIADDSTVRWFSPADGVEYGFCGTCPKPIDAARDHLDLWREGWVRYLEDGTYIWICADCAPTMPTP